MIEWEPFAKGLGYSSAPSMWKDLYETKQLTVAQISRKLNVSRNVVRANLTKAGVKMKGRGGPNNSRVVVTDDLLNEIRKDGLTTTAARHNLDYSTLYKRLRARGLSVASLRVPVPAESPETASQPSPNHPAEPQQPHPERSDPSPTERVEPPADTSSETAPR